MKVIVDYQGKRYEGAETADEKGLKPDVIDSFFNHTIGNIGKFRMELQGGGWLILPKQACETAVFMFLP